jgi:hypothetical protein
LICSISIYTLSVIISRPQNTLITERCSEVIQFDSVDEEIVNFMYGLISQQGVDISLQLQLSIHVFLYTVILINMLKRSPQLGQLILMITEMVDELQRYLGTIFLILIAFILVGRINQREFMVISTSIYQIAMDVFDAYVGNQNYTSYTYPKGKTYLSVIAYCS